MKIKVGSFLKKIIITPPPAAQPSALSYLNSKSPVIFFVWQHYKKEKNN
jgi:hypothetical protein